MHLDTNTFYISILQTKRRYLKMNMGIFKNEGIFKNYGKFKNEYEAIKIAQSK